MRSGGLDSWLQVGRQGILGRDEKYEMAQCVTSIEDLIRSVCEENQAFVTCSLWRWNHV